MAYLGAYTTKELEDLCELIGITYGSIRLLTFGLVLPFKEIPLWIHQDVLNTNTKKVLRWRLTINK